ncbi:hypothetical protein Q5O14_09125 [Eubacteriaceae bacterium ES2]|nr:hypothetical protein Q5O14_09125 [Eubacteriaceae bacterium ES2]
MKKKLLVLLVLLSLVLSSAGYVFAGGSTYGAEGALADQNLTLEEMLTYSIQDEYIAQAEYARIICIYGTINPFANIIKAEGQHIAALEPLFANNGLTVPVNDAASRVVLPASLMESYQTGVTAEINNIAMYDKFLAEDLPDEVRTVFDSLRAASVNHLKAFQKNLDKTAERDRK